MTLAISTRWNAYRHRSGEDAIEEIRDLGFDHVELGFDLSLDMAEGIRKMVASKAVAVDSVHNFCPVPAGFGAGHPELFELASLDGAMRESAVRHTLETAGFAAELGARFVVVHAGRVEMGDLTGKLIDLYERKGPDAVVYEKAKMKLLMQRDKKAGKHVDALCLALERMLPELQKLNVAVALENLPSWESVPSEVEMERILMRFDSPFLRYWHDFGHAQTRQNLGLIAHRRWLEKLARWAAGAHIHDVMPPAHDHLMPPRGKMDFESFKFFGASDIVRVLEPAPGTPRAEIEEGKRRIEQAWGLAGRGVLADASG